MVDLCGKISHEKGKEFGPDKMTTVMSSGKSVASILMALMVDCGFLNLDNKVTKYWPEFGKNYKGFIKVSDVMRHGCGLHRLHQTLEKEWMLP